MGLPLAHRLLGRWLHRLRACVAVGNSSAFCLKREGDLGERKVPFLCECDWPVMR